MLGFVVIAGRDGERPPVEVLDRLAQQAGARLPFEAASSVRWTASGGRVVVLAWDLHPRDYPPGPRWHVDDRGFTAFAGSAHPAGERWAAGSWARQLADRLADGPGHDPAAHSAGSTWGIHTLVHLGADGRGYVRPDPLSVGLVYRASTPTYEIVSNRADLAAVAAGTYLDRDPVGSGWLLVFEYLVDDRTSFRGVRSVSPGRATCIDADGTVTEARIDGETWRGGPADYQEALAALDLDLRDHVATVAALDRNAEVSLTGGRDSRLVLALAVAEGVEGAVRYMTAESFPGERDPDVEVASMLAERLGLEHRVLRMNYQDWTPDEFERRVRVHAHTTSGMLGAKNLRARLAVRGHIQVSGAFGENLTGPRSGDAPPASVEEAFEFMVAKMYGGQSGGFVRHDARAHYLALLRSTFDELSGDGTPPDELPYRFYVEYYLRGGVAREVEWTGIAPNVEPLYSVHLPAVARAAGWYGRLHHRAHLDLMLATAPELAGLPFANFSWPAALLAPMPGGDRLHQDPIVYSGALRASRGRRWEDHVDVYRRHLLDDPNHPIADLVDLAMVEEVLAGARPMPPAGRLQLDNALGAAVWLAGDELPAPTTIADVERANRSWRPAADSR